MCSEFELFFFMYVYCVFLLSKTDDGAALTAQQYLHVVAAMFLVCDVM